MKEIRLLKEKGRDQKGEMSPAAATAIQKVWRGYIARRSTKKRKREEQLLIGMELPPYKESEQIKQAENVSLIMSKIFFTVCSIFFEITNNYIVYYNYNELCSLWTVLRNITLCKDSHKTRAQNKCTTYFADHFISLRLVHKTAV